MSVKEGESWKLWARSPTMSRSCPSCPPSSKQQQFSQKRCQQQPKSLPHQQQQQQQQQFFLRHHRWQGGRQQRRGLVSGGRRSQASCLNIHPPISAQTTPLETLTTSFRCQSQIYQQKKICSLWRPNTGCTPLWQTRGRMMRELAVPMER